VPLLAVLAVLAGLAPAAAAIVAGVAAAAVGSEVLTLRRRVHAALTRTTRGAAPAVHRRGPEEAT
jgi:hypothetical protein